MDQEYKEIVLPSGAVLGINPAPFDDANELKRVVLAELKNVEFSGAVDQFALLKNLVCSGFSSKEIESHIHKCMKRCTYRGERIDVKQTFEPIEARGDYLLVLWHVAEENIAPFLSGLSSRFTIAKDIVTRILTFQESPLQNHPSSTT